MQFKLKIAAAVRNNANYSTPFLQRRRISYRIHPAIWIYGTYWSFTKMISPIESACSYSSYTIATRQSLRHYIKSSSIRRVSECAPTSSGTGTSCDLLTSFPHLVNKEIYMSFSVSLWYSRVDGNVVAKFYSFTWNVILNFYKKSSLHILHVKMAC